MPVTITRCSNNYGPYHFPEKLIPLIIKNILGGKIFFSQFQSLAFTLIHPIIIKIIQCFTHITAFPLYIQR